MSYALLQAVAASPDPFFTNDWMGFFKILGMVAGFTVVVWGMMKGKLQGDINGVGDRVKQLELEKERVQERLDEVTFGVRESRQDRANLHSQVGEIKTAQGNLTDLIHEMQVNIIAEIQKTRDTVTEAHIKLRERIVRLETISQIEKYLGKRKEDDKHHD